MRRRSPGEVAKQTPTIRDRNRLEQLDEYFGKKVYSFADAASDEYDLQFHFPHRFGRRAVRNFKLPKDFEFDLIMADYFRFPVAYMKEAYSNLAETLNALKEKKLIGIGVIVLLPNSHSKYLDVNTLKSDNTCEWKRSFIQANENPLAFVTEAMPAKSLLGYTNASQIKLLDNPPFIKLTLVARH
jgi:hypothetical protein